MRRPDKYARIAALLVVATGSSGVTISCIAKSYELATTCVAFACVGLYLLFGKEPPSPH
jgi:hypothetical protein